MRFSLDGETIRRDRRDAFSRPPNRPQIFEGHPLLKIGRNQGRPYGPVGQDGPTGIKPGIHRQIALVTLATAEEQKKDCKTAVQHYGEAQTISGALQNRAVLGRARCAEQLGDTQTAITAYREYLKENPGSPLAIKLAELEAKVPGTPASASK